MKILKNIIKLILGDYSLYRIYLFDAKVENPGKNQTSVNLNSKLSEISDISLLQASPYKEIAILESYGGDGAYGFGAWNNKGELVSACWFWDKVRYQSRNFWPLKEKEAKLVQINTSLAYQGQGIARNLLLFATDKMTQKGFERIYARIWHSNTPSLKAFEKAGWKYVAFVIEIFPLGRKKPFRWRISKHASTFNSDNRV